MEPCVSNQKLSRRSGPNWTVLHYTGQHRQNIWAPGGRGVGLLPLPRLVQPARGNDWEGFLQHTSTNQR